MSLPLVISYYIMSSSIFVFFSFFIVPIVTIVIIVSIVTIRILFFPSLTGRAGEGLLLLVFPSPSLTGRAGVDLFRKAIRAVADVNGQRICAVAVYARRITIVLGLPCEGTVRTCAKPVIP